MADAESSARQGDGRGATQGEAASAGGARAAAPDAETPRTDPPRTDPAPSADQGHDSEAEYEDPEQGDEQRHGDDTETGRGRGDWQGSRVTQEDIDWLIKSRRIPAGVECRLPGDEISPDPNQGERVVFVSHFERGLGLPVSYFFRSFLDKFHLQPHHLPPNTILFLSALATFQEGYLGVWPTVDLCAGVYSLSA